MVRLRSAEWAKARAIRIARSSPHFLGDSGRSCCFCCNGNSHDKGAPLAVFVVAAEDFSTMSADDSIANAEAEARALGGLFGGVKRIEDALGVWDAGTVVGDSYFDVLIVAARVNHDASALSGVLNGIVGVVQDIQEDLLQLLGIAECRGQVFVEVFDDLHAVAGKIVATKLDGLAQDVVDVNEFTLHRPLASEAEQILDNVF